MGKNISYRVVESPSSPLPKEFLTDLPYFFEKSGKSIYRKRNEVKLFQVEGRTIAVKKYGIPPNLNRFLYSVGWREPKAKRTYENAQEILKRGFRTPQQYGYVLAYKKGWLDESFSVGEFIEQVRPVQEERKNKKMVRALARYTFSLHAHGLMHRDYVLNNVLYNSHAGKYQFVLIDINRFVFRQKPICGFLLRMNLMQPFSTQRDTAYFVKAYIQAARAPQSLYWQVLAFRWIRSRYSQLKRLLKKIPGARSIGKHRLQ